MKRFCLFFLVATLLASVPSISIAKNGSYYSPGTGSKISSTYVHGYVKKNGTYVSSYRRSTSDGNFKNNWTTKGNVNPYTGKRGTRYN